MRPILHHGSWRRLEVHGYGYGFIVRAMVRRRRSSVVDRGRAGTPQFGGKKFKLEIDSSIWREEIGNRNRLVNNLAGNDHIFVLRRLDRTDDKLNHAYIFVQELTSTDRY